MSISIGPLPFVISFLSYHKALLCVFKDTHPRVLVRQSDHGVKDRHSDH